MPEVDAKTRREWGVSSWLSALRAIAALSSLNLTVLGLDGFGPTTPYFPHLPNERKTGLRAVHGDYKLDNMIFHRLRTASSASSTGNYICSPGSPLADLTNLTQPWAVDPKLAESVSIMVGFRGTTNQPADLTELEG